MSYAEVQPEVHRTHGCLTLHHHPIEIDAVEIFAADVASLRAAAVSEIASGPGLDRRRTDRGHHRLHHGTESQKQADSPGSPVPTSELLANPSCWTPPARTGPPERR